MPQPWFVGFLCGWNDLVVLLYISHAMKARTLLYALKPKSQMPFLSLANLFPGNWTLYPMHQPLANMLHWKNQSPHTKPLTPHYLCPTYLIKPSQILTDIERYPADPKSKFSLPLWTLTFGLQKIWLEIIWKAGSIFRVPFLKYQVFAIFQWEPILKYETLKIKIQSYIAKILSFLISELEKTGVFCIP